MVVLIYWNWEANNSRFLSKVHQDQTDKAFLFSSLNQVQNNPNIIQTDCVECVQNSPKSGQKMSKKDISDKYRTIEQVQSEINPTLFTHLQFIEACTCTKLYISDAKRPLSSKIGAKRSTHYVGDAVDISHKATAAKPSKIRKCARQSGIKRIGKCNAHTHIDVGASPSYKQVEWTCKSK